MDDTLLVKRFEECSLAPSELGHREHVQLAWAYMRTRSFEAASERFCTGLQRFACAQGKPDRFHATITWAYLTLVNERIHTRRASSDFARFTDENPDLFDQKTGALATYYDKATLDSETARRIFLLPRPASVR
jgi:hypothetical protein